MLSVYDFPQLLEHLGLVVLERLSDGSLTTYGKVPAWFRQLQGELPDGPDPSGSGQSFAFLENFLIDAEEFWAAKQPGALKSGICTAYDNEGNPCHFEARALLTGERRFLVLESLGEEFEERQALYQKAREKNLLYEELQRTEAALRASEARNREIMRDLEAARDVAEA